MFRSLLIYMFFLLCVAVSHAQESAEIKLETFEYQPDGVFRRYGDMILKVEVSESGDQKAVRPLNVKKWPSGVLPIKFDDSFSEAERRQFFQGCRWWEDASKVQCRLRNKEKNYIFVNKSDVNNSFLGMIGGKQVINLHNTMHPGIIAHEIAHALGFAHQHNAPNRNKYITVNYNNIDDVNKHNFDIIANALTFGAYDFCSIMHYEPSDFSLGQGRPSFTINAAIGDDCIIGQRRMVSDSDMFGMAYIYGRDPHDILITEVPNFISDVNMSLENTDAVYRRYSVRISPIEGSFRSYCIPRTSCETECHNPRVYWQYPNPGTRVEVGTVVSLKVEDHVTHRFFSPPAGGQCE